LTTPASVARQTGLPAGRAEEVRTTAVARIGPAHWDAVEGTAHPLGVTFVEADAAYNFALYSKHATRVRLLLYAIADLINPIHVQELEWRIHKSGRVWHCRVPDGVAGQADYYGYQLDGPREPWNGHRFDFDKILLDPFAPAVFFPEGFDRKAAREPGGNAGRAPLGVLRPRSAPFDWTGDQRPRHTHDTIIYELHVGGFTRRANSGVTPESRGTFAGLIEKIPYLKELGVTAVELMPVFQFDPQERNFWGYMPISFFALHHAYGRCCELGEEIDEFKALVKALHQADIELLLDVVFNHTGEGDERGPTYSFRGIDNSTYYLLEEDRRRYRNDSGTGNVVHSANRYVRAMILDALRYWVSEMHVDPWSE
jgi:isoamylase